MKKYRMFGMAAGLFLAVSLVGCGKKTPEVSTAPAVEYTSLADAPAPADGSGAELEVLDFNQPIDFSYSSADTDMVFEMEDGLWLDGMENEIPINQERFSAMADGFLHLKAVTKVEEPGDLSQYGLTNESYSVYITDGEKGEANIQIGNQDPEGNYYMTRDGRTVYTIKKELVDSLIFDYNSLVVRDSLDLTVAAADMAGATVTGLGETTSFNGDSAAMERIAKGISALKPEMFSSYNANAQELEAAGFGEETVKTFVGEFKVNGENRSLTVHIGGFANPEETLRYVMLDGSKMIAMVDNAVIGDLLGGLEDVTE